MFTYFFMFVILSQKLGDVNVPAGDHISHHLKAPNKHATSSIFRHASLNEVLLLQLSLPVRRMRRQPPTFLHIVNFVAEPIQQSQRDDRR